MTRRQILPVRESLSVLVLLLFLLVFLPSAAHAQGVGFIQAAPATGIPLCSSITNPVPNRTWCADGNAPYHWRVWNGSTYDCIDCGGGGGGITGLGIKGLAGIWSSATNLSYNPGIVYVAPYGTNRTAIQQAINDAPVGSTVQLDCAQTYMLDPTPISIAKPIALQGCTSQGGGIFNAFPTSGALIGAASRVISIDTPFAVIIKNVAIKNAAGGTGIYLTSTAAPVSPFLTTVNVRSIIEKNWIDGGDYGIVGEKGKVGETLVQDNYISNTAIKGTLFQGVLSPADGTSNCDGGGYRFRDNQVEAQTGDGFAFDNTAGLNFYSNTTVGAMLHGLHMRVSPAGNVCSGAGPTQNQFGLNQLTGIGGAAFLLESIAYGTGWYSIGTNWFGGAGDDVVQMIATPLTFPITAVNQGAKTFTVSGDFAARFPPGLAFTVTGSTGNNGVYTVVSAVFGAGVTVITVVEVIPNATANGSITLTGNIFGVTFTGNTVKTNDQVTTGSVFTSGLLGSVFSGNQIETGVATTTYGFKMTDVRYAVMVIENTILNPVANGKVYQGTGYTLTSSVNPAPNSFNLANLPAAENGSSIWCTDCLATNPCTSGGTGAKASRSGGAWTCGSLGIGAGVNTEIAVYNSASTIAGHADFTWDETNAIFKTFSSPTITQPAHRLTLINSTGTIDGTATLVDQATLFSVSSANITNGAASLLIAVSDTPTVSQSGPLVSFADDHPTFTGVNNNNFSAASFHPSTTLLSLRTAILASQSGSVSGCSNTVVLGGTGGSCTGPAIGNVASINGGVVTTADTTAVGGTILDVHFGSPTNDFSAAGGFNLAVGAANTDSGSFANTFGTGNNNSGNDVFIALDNNVNTANSSFIACTSCSNTGTSFMTMFGRGGTNTGGKSFLVSLDTGYVTNGGDFNILMPGAALTVDASSSDNTVIGGAGSLTTSGTNALFGGASTVWTFNTVGSSATLSSTGTVTVTGNSDFVLLNTNATWPFTTANVITGAVVLATQTGVYLAAGTNEQFVKYQYATELLTIAAAATTDTTFSIPANCTVDAVTTRVTVAIPTAATYDTGVVGSTTLFGTGTSTAATTTNASTGTTTPLITSGSTKIRITPNAPPAANTGRVRVSASYHCASAPTS